MSYHLDDLRIVHIKNTFELKNIRVSVGCSAKLRKNPNVSFGEEEVELHFDRFGNMLLLLPPFRNLGLEGKLPQKTSRTRTTRQRPPRESGGFLRLKQWRQRNHQGKDLRKETLPKAPENRLAKGRESLI